MADEILPNLLIQLPDVGADEDTWGNILNDNYRLIDAKVVFKNVLGNVGIGVSTPLARLHVENTGSGESQIARFQRTNGADNAALRININPDTNNVSLDSTGAASGALEIRRGGSLSAIFDVNGNVGVGTLPAPNWTAGARIIQTGNFASFGEGRGGTSDLTVSWNALVTSNIGSGQGYTYKVSTDRASAYEQNGQHRWYIAPPGTAGTPISFTQAMTLDFNGNLLIGAAFAEELGLTLRSENCVQNSLSVSTKLWGFRYSGIETGSITRNTTTTSYNTASDERLKENITEAEPTDSIIDSIQIRKFDWKSSGEHQRYGVIAQELDQVFPEAVSKSGSPEAMMGVDYSKLVPVLIKEIQSLRARVAQLEA